MAILQNYCFWFSVRMGSIIVSISTGVQCAIWLMISIISVGNPEDFYNKLNNFDMTYGFIDTMAENPKTFLVSLIIFFFGLLIACILAIVGSLLFKHQFLYGFVVLNFLYVVFLVVFDVFLMLNFKAKNTDLGLLILYANLSFFILLYFVYSWAIVFSLLQILRETRSGDSKRSENIFLRNNSRVANGLYALNSEVA